MQRTRKSGRADREPAADHGPMQLPSDRAFVLHLDARARPPQFTVGRVEHVMSGRVGHFASLDRLIAFSRASGRPADERASTEGGPALGPSGARRANGHSESR